MNKYEYSIEKMDKNIAYFKAIEKNDCITKEEFTYLFGGSAPFPSYYFIGSGKHFDYFSISDYDYYQLKNGYNPFTGEFYYTEPTAEELIEFEEYNSINEGEYEAELEDDFEYYASLRTKTKDIYVSSISELTNLLNSELHETIYNLRIHCNADNAKFLISVFNLEDIYYYQIILESSNDGMYLGSCINSKYVLDIIQILL